MLFILLKKHSSTFSSQKTRVNTTQKLLPYFFILDNFYHKFHRLIVLQYKTN